LIALLDYMLLFVVCLNCCLKIFSRIIFNINKISLRLKEQQHTHFSIVVVFLKLNEKNIDAPIRGKIVLFKVGDDFVADEVDCIFNVGAYW
jgi:hypothetical protein